MRTDESQRVLTIHTLSEPIPFDEALTEFGRRFKGPAVGFAYTPSQVPWFRSSADDWLTREGDPVPQTAFELRVFNEQAEMRWRRTTGFDGGDSVILSHGESEDPSESTRAFWLGDRTLSLWGVSVGASADGWTNLRENRIGDRVWVPLGGVEQGATVNLVIAEYAKRDRYGNIAVVEQTLCRLSAQPLDERA